MSVDVATRILVSLQEEARTMEKNVARGTLEQFTASQNKLFGMEEAIKICKKVISESDED